MPASRGPASRRRAPGSRPRGGRGASPPRGCPRLAGGILGRVDDMLVIRGMNVFPSAIEDVVRRFDCVDEFRVEVRRRAEMAEVRVVVEVDDTRWGAARVAATLDELREQLQLACGLRIETAAVAAGALPRFQLKARR